MVDRLPWVVECDDPPNDCPAYKGKCWTGYLGYGVPGFDTEDAVRGFALPEEALDKLADLPGEWPKRCFVRKRNKP